MPSIDVAAILFDLDGVLVDSKQAVENAWREWATAQALDPEFVLRTAHGLRTADVIRRVAPHLSAADEAQRLEAAESVRVRGLRRIAGVDTVVAVLPAGRWAVVTSGMRTMAEHRLRFAGLPVPAVMICADDVQRGKPDPEGYLAAARALGVAADECVVVEDAPNGIDAARAAGAQVIAVRTTYADDALHRANFVVDSVASLRVAVSGARLHISFPSTPGPHTPPT